MKKQAFFKEKLKFTLKLFSVAIAVPEEFAFS